GADDRILHFFHVQWPGVSVARSDTGQRPGPYQPGATPGATPGQRPRSKAQKNNPKRQRRGPISEIIERRMLVPHRASKPLSGVSKKNTDVLPPRHGTEFHERYARD